jgi:hypothetical protein
MSQSWPTPKSRISALAFARATHVAQLERVLEAAVEGKPRLAFFHAPLRGQPCYRRVTCVCKLSGCNVTRPFWLTAHCTDWATAAAKMLSEVTEDGRIKMAAQRRKPLP